MTPDELTAELQRQPWPKCRYCTNRAHGLFQRTLDTTKPEPGDDILESTTVWIWYTDKKTGDKNKFRLTKCHVVRYDLLCASHGFELSGTSLIRSLNATFKPKAIIPEWRKPDGTTVSKTLNKLRAKPSTVPASIMNSWNPLNRGVI